jgi:hypothetical protein
MQFVEPNGALSRFSVTAVMKMCLHDPHDVQSDIWASFNLEISVSCGAHLPMPVHIMKNTVKSIGRYSI